MLNGMEFQTVGAAFLKALRPTAVLVNGTCRKLCDADRRVLKGVLRLMKGERLQANQFEVQYTVCYKVNALLDGEPMKLLKSSSGCYC